MFTGIVETTGTVTRLTSTGSGKTLTLETDLDLSHTKVGDSIAVDGVCLTATHLDGASVTFDCGPESLRLTTLDDKRPGDRLHLERALAFGGRLDGHLMQGHVDGVGRVQDVRRQGETTAISVHAPDDVLALCVKKGSIAVDGVSLTINDVQATTFDIWLIPHTGAVTHLAGARPGQRVNLETDIIGKYVARLLRPRAAAGLTWDDLKKHGFMS